jgi:hypothetical protein
MQYIIHESALKFLKVGHFVGSLVHSEFMNYLMNIALENLKNYANNLMQKNWQLGYVNPLEHAFTRTY